VQNPPINKQKAACLRKRKLIILLLITRQSVDCRAQAVTCSPKNAAMDAMTAANKQQMCKESVISH
jgi:hypothetical protein